MLQRPSPELLMAAASRALPRTLAPHVAAVRRFNRLYTRRIGALAARHLGSPFSLTEVRVLYEIAHRDAATATDLTRALDLDPGYLSRLLHRFARRGLVHIERSTRDGRRRHLALTPRGRATVTALDARASAEIASLLAPLRPRARTRVVSSMRAIERALAPGEAPPTPAALRLRAPRRGDLGWIVHRHAVLFGDEYGYDQRFEALVAEIVAHYVRHLDAARERCWVAELDGEIVGSVFCVAASRTVAKLRLLLVEPEARGLGVGGRLVRACIAFARHAGYRTLTLWTQRELAAARRLYEREGFRKVREEPNRAFGTPSVAETWELALGGQRDPER